MSIEIYLDNAATTPVLPEVIQEVVECLERDYGNPSSLHRMGVQAEKRIKEARQRVADVLRVKPEEITFTSGGTESNNLAILGTAQQRKQYGNHCVTTAIEHPSVSNTFLYLEKEGWDVTYLPVDNQGLIDLDILGEALNSNTVLVSIMHVNNEIGSVQPLREIGILLRNKAPNAVFHVDAIQSFGKLDLHPKEWGIDLMSISGHKIHAPKGVGALYVRSGIRLKALQWGGGQERGLRSGTENLPGIAGLGKAAEWVGQRLAKDSKKLHKLKKELIQGIVENIPEVKFNGPRPGEGAPHIVNISVPGVRGEVLLHVLESKGVYVSTGSACSSKKNRISHVLKAIGAEPEVAEGAIRISLSYLNTPEEMRELPVILKKAVDEVKRFTRR